MVILHVAGAEATGLASEWCHLSDKVSHSLAKLCQACCSSVSVVSNFLCVNGLCSPICLARREGDNPEELCGIGSSDAQQLTCLTLLQAWLSKGLEMGAQALFVTPARAVDCHGLFQCGMVILTSLAKPTEADRSWGHTEVCRISVTLWG